MQLILGNRGTKETILTVIKSRFTDEKINTVKLLYLSHLHEDLYFFSGLMLFFENFPHFDGKNRKYFEKSSF